MPKENAEDDKAQRLGSKNQSSGSHNCLSTA